MAKETGVISADLSGGDGGLLVSEDFSGRRLTRFQVWFNRDAEEDADRIIVGLEITMTDSFGDKDTKMFGKKEQEETTFRHDDITLGLDYTFTRVTLWDNGAKELADRRLGKIDLRAEKPGGGSGTRFLTLGVEHDNAREVNFNFGSGICVGYKVRHDEAKGALYAFAFQFLRPIKECKITNVRYDPFPDSATTVKTIEEMSQKNLTKNPVVWEWSGRTPRKTRSKWSYDAAIIAGETVTVAAGIPILKRVDGEDVWSTGPAEEHSATDELTIGQINWTDTGSIPRYSTVLLTASSGKIKLAGLRYTATMVISTRGSQKGVVPDAVLYDFVGEFEGKVISQDGIVTVITPEETTNPPPIVNPPPTTSPPPVVNPPPTTSPPPTVIPRPPIPGLPVQGDPIVQGVPIVRPKPPNVPFAFPK